MGGIVVGRSSWMQQVSCFDLSSRRERQQSQEEYRKMVTVRNEALRQADADNVLTRYNDEDVKKLAEQEMARQGIDELPASIDWAKAGFVQAVRDQGQCRSCYAIATVTVIEAVEAIEKYKVDPSSPSPTKRLSVYDIVDNCPTTSGCNGGAAVFAADYIRQKGGLPMEPRKKQKNGAAIDDVFHAVNIRKIVSISCEKEESLKYALYALGPLVVTIDASEWQFKRSHKAMADDDDDSFNDEIVFHEVAAPKETATRKRGATAVAADENGVDPTQDDEDSFDCEPIFVEIPRKKPALGPSPHTSPEKAPIKRRSPKKLLPQDDPNVPGFPELDGISINENGPRHQHLKVKSSTPSEGTLTLVCEVIEGVDCTNNKENMHTPEGDFTVYLQGIWSECTVRVGTSIRIVNPKRWSDTEWLVDDETGFVVTESATLVPCTAVVQSFFCARKAVLGERLKGGGNAVSRAMLMGIIIHELFQAVLQSPPSLRVTKEWLIKRWREGIMDEVLVSLTAVALSPEAFEAELEPYIEVILEWIRNHMPGRAAPGAVPRPLSGGGRESAVVQEVHDIEENIWAPLLGLKGKVDASLLVQPSPSSAPPFILPLELKTGKSAISSDHAGQVLMYAMMLSHRHSLPINWGSLVYLKDGTTRGVVPRANELRAIIARRNDVASKTAEGREFLDLPPPRASSRFCAQCDLAPACTLSGAANGEQGEGISDEALAFRLEATGHLAEHDVEYFKKWIRWIGMEAATGRSTRPHPSTLWMLPAGIREQRSPTTCMASLRLRLCLLQRGDKEGRYTAVFQRDSTIPIPFSRGDFVIVSTDDAPAVVMGPVMAVSHEERTVAVLSDRKLLEEKGGRAVLYSLDRHESAATTSIQLNNVVALMSAEPKCTRLRQLIVDLAPATQLKNMNKSHVDQLKLVTAGLKKQQVSAVISCLLASDYNLIEGLPGSGKTTVLVALIRGAVATGRSVLLTAYTHSAVDNLLAKLAQHFDASKLLRVGKYASVHANVKHLTLEDKLDLTPLENKYAAMRHTLASTVDESSLVLESSLIGPLLAADRYVLVGDAKQLAPLVLNEQAKEEGMGVSLFERLLDAKKARVTTLSVQFRMNRTLARIPSDLFYEGRLECDESIADACLDTMVPGWKEGTASELALPLDGSVENSAVFIDTRLCEEPTGDDSLPPPTISANGGISNEGEAAVVAKLVHAFIKRGLVPSSLGVMCMYRKQTELIRGMPEIPAEVEVNTVDQWQGRDKSVVICSLAWTLSHGRKRSDLLEDARRINVALTRAKHKLVFVGCGRSMRERCPLVASALARMTQASL